MEHHKVLKMYKVDFVESINFIELSTGQMGLFEKSKINQQ